MSDVINSAKLPVELVFAVVVSYRCDMARLMSQIERLLEQVSNVVWVDNDSDINLAPYIKLFPASRLHCIILEKNHGIAYAQNKGIELALESKATHVLLMDHDSLPGQKMVDKLLLALHERPDAAAVGPCYMDPRRTKQKTPFFNVRNGWRLQWLDCTDPDVVWPVDHVIASGCLIPAPVLRRVGLMRADYFIDWVDIEWSLRAKRQGYLVYGVCAAQLEHKLGDQVVRVLGREIPLHAPWRHYYQARNLVFTLGSPGVDKTSSAHHIIQQAKRFIVFSTCVPGRLRYLKMWILGLIHGLAGISGYVVKYDPMGNDR